MKPLFDIVVAHDAKYGIGYANQLAWHLPEDMAYFKQLTMGSCSDHQRNIVIMGRKTYESIPKAFRPLRDRFNIVLSQSDYYPDHDDVRVAVTIEDALIQAETLVNSGDAKHIYCIGGNSIYEKMIYNQSCRYLYVTYLDDVFECDAFFPSYESGFTLLKTTEKRRSMNGLFYQFKQFQSHLFDGRC